jgi:hypothetical protein
MFESGDVIIRSLSEDGFLLVDAVTRKTLNGPFPTFADALNAALGFVKPGATIWQENVDNRGRPLGPPFRVV